MEKYIHFSVLLETVELTKPGSSLVVALPPTVHFLPQLRCSLGKEGKKTRLWQALFKKKSILMLPL